MRRRRAAPADSLELLLDTICNTFGGVLFIAILVSLLLRLSGNENAASPEDVVSPEELETLADEWSVASAELASLRRMRASQNELMAHFAPEKTRALVGQRNAFDAAGDRLNEQVEQQRLENAQASIRIEQARQEIVAAEKALDLEKQKQARLDEEIEQNRQARTREVRMPVVHAAGIKQEFGIIVRYGRMYLWHKYDQFGNRQGLNTDEFVVVEEGTDQITTTPNPTAGIPLDSETADARIRARLAQFRPRSSYPVIVLRPDSFGQFAALRNTLVAMGFEYRLMLAGDGEVIADRGGSGGDVQ